MLFTPLLTLVLAAMAIAAPAPDFDGFEERGLEDRAVSFEGIAFGLTAAIRQYRNNPSNKNNLAAICRYKAALSTAQQTSAANLGFSFAAVTCPTTTDQLNTIQAGLGDAYATFSATGGQTPANTQALCAITTTLTPAQRRSIAALGVIINVQCPSIVDQLNTIQAGLGQAYQAYTRNPNRLNTNTLCTLISQESQTQKADIAAIQGLTLNPTCPTLATKLDAISNGLSTAYNNLLNAPTVFANQLAYCQITTDLNFSQRNQLSALALDASVTAVNCNNVITQNRANNILAGLGDAYFAWVAAPSATTKQTLCALIAQLTRAQKNRLLNNLGINVATVQCTT
ncbi:hypothetical protein CYLTODRAFT_418396 [Cylindrobasidium torrendii FP15055 ss-10]|uniref:Secreted protein n=1 Tax=Cylindrobasidium torrendii FP15055 ss-10 TaxID=1314674 RepID=A0A0D7BN82_9AGAR|nr:hypothetical protein CYLTODRAFT_418396 [Cylindrobasidium torrendii FP15055 ss-10]